MWAKIIKIKRTKDLNYSSLCAFNLIHEFHNVSWITEINEFSHDILIYWDAPIYIYVNNTLMQIHFNGTNFINVRLTHRVFSVWPVAQPVVGEMEMHSVANLAKLQAPLATFSLQKSFQTLFNLWELPSTAARARGLAFTVCTHTSLFLARSLRRLSLCSTGGSRQRRAAL